MRKVYTAPKLEQLGDIKDVTASLTKQQWRKRKLRRYRFIKSTSDYLHVGGMS